jgi:glycosyltransferase involved in cell wall biosynthesis
MSTLPTVSICIANYKQDHLLPEAIASCEMQTYPNEVVVFNDTEGIGSGESFNKAIEMAKGDIIVLLCADDIITDKHFVWDLVYKFDHYSVGHVSRYYHQFVDGNRSPVRAWRSKNVLELANNPSGLAFRREYLKDCTLTNKMFIEAPMLVKQVLDKGFTYEILKYDAIAVRVHASTARNPGYYKDRWVSSPIEEWTKIGGESLLKDYTSLIQIKNYFTVKAVLNECCNFIKLRPLNLLMPHFWFFALLSLLTPRSILIKIPDWYRATVGKWITREVKR